MRKRKPTRTLFDIDYKKHFRRHCRNYPYSWLIKGMDDQDDPDFPEYEPCFFNDVLDYEVQLYNGWQTPICGPLTLKVNGKSINLKNEANLFRLPIWIESDALQFKKSGAKGIVVFEWRLDKVATSRIWRSLNLIGVSGLGIPRAATRRVIHRLRKELELPVYWVGANDTWAYFIYSVVKRGVLGPHAQCPYLAVPDVRFLGMCSGDIEKCSFAQRFLEKWAKLGMWKPEWDLRLKAMKKYPCFQSPQWQEEFKRFRKQHVKYEICQVMEDLGADRFCEEFIQKKLEARTWLT